MRTFLKNIRSRDLINRWQKIFIKELQALAGGKRPVWLMISLESLPTARARRLDVHRTCGARSFAAPGEGWRDAQDGPGKDVLLQVVRSQGVRTRLPLCRLGRGSHTSCQPHPPPPQRWCVRPSPPAGAAGAARHKGWGTSHQPIPPNAQHSTMPNAPSPIPMPNSQCPMPTGHCPMPTARYPVPSAQCAIPNAQSPIPDAHCPIPKDQCPVLTRCPIPNAQ